MSTPNAVRTGSTEFTAEAADRIHDISRIAAVVLSRGREEVRANIQFRLEMSLSRLSTEHAVSNQSPAMSAADVDAVLEPAVTDFYEQIAIDNREKPAA